MPFRSFPTLLLARLSSGSKGDSRAGRACLSDPGIQPQCEITTEPLCLGALITGGAGFIGSHLSESLLDRGWTVEVVDDLSTGSIENIRHLKGHPHFAYTLDSVMNRSLMLELVDRADVIFHLSQAQGEVFNIGHTEEIWIYELAVLVKTMTKSASEIMLVPYEQAYEAGFERHDPRPVLDLPETATRARQASGGMRMSPTQLIVQTSFWDPQRPELN